MRHVKQEHVVVDMINTVVVKIELLTEDELAEVKEYFTNKIGIGERQDDLILELIEEIRG